MSGPEQRAEAIAELRAIADLLEADQSVPLPSTQVNFWVRHTGDNAAVGTRIAQALAGPWTSRQVTYGSDFLELRSRPASGLKVDVLIPAEDACTEEGTRTVTVWKPLPAIAALAPGQQEGGES